MSVNNSHPAWLCQCGRLAPAIHSNSLFKLEKSWKYVQPQIKVKNGFWNNTLSLVGCGTVDFVDGMKFEICNASCKNIFLPKEQFSGKRFAQNPFDGCCILGELRRKATDLCFWLSVETWSQKRKELKIKRRKLQILSNTKSHFSNTNEISLSLSVGNEHTSPLALKKFPEFISWFSIVWWNW